jgi:hypothetical protein
MFAPMDSPVLSLLDKEKEDAILYIAKDGFFFPPLCLTNPLFFLGTEGGRILNLLFYN